MVFHKKRNISSITIIFIFIVLAIIITITTYRDILREREYVFETLKNRGITLAFSLRESILINVSTLDNNQAFLQTLIEKASKDRDIAYIALVNEKNTIVAHSDSKNVGETLSLELGENKYIDRNKINHRFITRPGTEEKIFEVIEPFLFFHPFSFSRDVEPGVLTEGNPIPQEKYDAVIPPPDVYWWIIGFKMENAVFATSVALYKALATAAILLILGSFAFYILFTFQKYYVIRETLENTTNSIGKILSSMSSGVIFINKEGEIITFNGGAENITGFKAEEVTGKSYASLFSEKEDVNNRHLMKALNNGYSCHDLETFRVMRDGKNLPLKLSVFPLYDQEEKIIGAGEIFQDLQQIKELEEKLYRADRLASLGKFAAGVAHEIRNPLASIKGFTQYLKGKLSPYEKESDYADIIIEEVERLDRVITGLLNFAKPRTFSMEMCNVNVILEDSILLIADQAQSHHVSVCKYFETDLPPVYADREQMKQVFLNIIINALQEMKDGGSLEVISSKSFDSSIVVEIHDSGRGILPDHLQNIFDPFFTTKEGGSGLGLSIANSIVEAHGGEIHVRSEPLKGTTFTIQLPINRKY